MTNKRSNISQELQSVYATLVATCAMTAYLGTQIVTGLAQPII